jgi:hypothetical protein
MEECQPTGPLSPLTATRSTTLPSVRKLELVLSLQFHDSEHDGLVLPRSILDEFLESLPLTNLGYAAASILGTAMRESVREAADPDGQGREGTHLVVFFGEFDPDGGVANFPGGDQAARAQ